MRCTVCASAMGAGERICPHCGEAVNVPRKRRAARHGAVRQPLTPAIDFGAQQGAGGMPRGRSVPPSPQREQELARAAYREEIRKAAASASEPIRVRRPPAHETIGTLSGKRISLQKRPVNWMMVLAFVLLFLIVVAITTVLLLTQTDMGRIQLAAWGYNVDVETQWKRGDLLMRNDEILQALAVFEQAYEEDPDSLEGAMQLGTALERAGRQEDAQALYMEVIESHPYYPEPYTRMIRVYQDEENHQAAIAMMELAIEKTEEEERQAFSDQLKAYMPDAPFANPIGARYTEDTLVTLQAMGAEELTIYYTLDESDPLGEGGILYEEPFLLTENEEQKRHVLRAVAVQQNGIPSKELLDTYTIEYPRPDAPSANVAPGTYEKSQKVRLYMADKKNDVVAIHYTIDGSTATTDSPIFNEDEPIVLPVGRSTLRAIAVDSRNKVSNEKVIEYKVQANLKKAFNADDVVGKFALMKTTYEQFEKSQGAPINFVEIESQGEHACYEATYGFGLARFIEQDEKRLLYEIQITGPGLDGPRKLKLGKEMVDAIALFRDRAIQPNENGERLLYNDDENRIGVLTREENGTLAAHYYYQRGVNDYAELSLYFSEDALLERIVWLRYEGDA